MGEVVGTSLEKIELEKDELEDLNGKSDLEEEFDDLFKIRAYYDKCIIYSCKALGFNNVFPILAQRLRSHIEKAKLEPQDLNSWTPIEADFVALGYIFQCNNKLGLRYHRC